MVNCRYRRDICERNSKYICTKAFILIQFKPLYWVERWMKECNWHTWSESNQLLLFLIASYIYNSVFNPDKVYIKCVNNFIFKQNHKRYVFSIPFADKYTVILVLYLVWPEFGLYFNNFIYKIFVDVYSSELFANEYFNQTLAFMYFD